MEFSVPPWRLSEMLIFDKKKGRAILEYRVPNYFIQFLFLKLHGKSRKASPGDIRFPLNVHCWAVAGKDVLETGMPVSSVIRVRDHISILAVVDGQKVTATLSL